MKSIWIPIKILHRKIQKFLLNSAFFRSHFPLVKVSFLYNKGIKSEERNDGFQCKRYPAPRAERYSITTETMVSEQTELIRSLRLIIDEKSGHEKALQEQVDYLTKKAFRLIPAKKDPMIFRDNRISSMKRKWNKTPLYRKKRP